MLLLMMIINNLELRINLIKPSG